MFKLADGRDCLYQWDSNLKLIVEDESISEVHFMARYSSEIYTVEVIRTESEAYVNIPNILLQQTYSVIAYAFCRDGSDYTKTESAFEVIARPKPSDYVYTETEVKSYKALEDRIKTLEQGGASDEAIVDAIRKYFKENGVPSVSNAKIGNVTLLAEKWTGGNNVYSQTVTVDGVTENSQVDLTPSVEQLAIFYEKDVTFLSKNAGGVVTIYAIGQKPLNDYTIQVTITEVDYE